MSLGTCTGGRGRHSQFWPPEKLWDCDVKRPSCASQSGELGAGLWHCCEVFNVMHWFIKTTCSHHQHRHELSRMYKNKDFWLKTSWRSLWSFQTTVERSRPAFIYQVELPQREERDVLYYHSEKEPYEGFFEWVCTRTVCVQNIWISLVHAKETFFSTA